MLGPGKYDEEASAIRESTDAQSVILIVIGGKRGSGFSVQATIKVIGELPQLLRTIATTIETDRT